MADFLRRNSLFFSALLLLVFSFQLMSSSVRNPDLPASGARFVTTMTAPVEKIHHKASTSLSDFWGNYISLIGVSKRQGVLEQKIKTLQATNSQLIEYEHENRRLRAMLGFVEKIETPGVVANVIARDPSNWLQTLTLDKGSSSGIREGFPLVDGHAIVGIATAVANTSSKVQLLSDPNSAVDALVQRTRAPGLVEGNGGKTLSMRYVEKGEEVKVGDRVVASGLDQVYPKGALIGVVTEIEAEAHGLFQKIVVKPGVDLDHLESVLVLESGLDTGLLKSDLKARAEKARVNVGKNKKEPATANPGELPGEGSDN